MTHITDAIPFLLTRRLVLMLQYRADRRTLAEMDDHLLADLGLRRGDLESGIPFRWTAPPDTQGFRCQGVLAVRDWTLKLYAPRGNPALRPEDHAMARRAVAATLATPGPTWGFAILCGLDHVGTLGLSSWWWEGDRLIAERLALSATGSTRRVPDVGTDIGTLSLLAREAAAWRRHVLEAPRPNRAAYLRQDCV